MKTLTGQITDCIECILDRGERFKKKIIIYPCGEVGMQVINIMRNIYLLEPALIIDNQKCKYITNIHNLSMLSTINSDEYIMILASTNRNMYEELKICASKYMPMENILELESMVSAGKFPKWKTDIGKYSYGPICYNHMWIESIGAFCSFAMGVDVVTNHEFRYITTHPIIYQGKHIAGGEHPSYLYKDFDYYMENIEPKSDMIKKQRRMTIGNDVWLGRNVIITNSSNIGNGVIAAAGAVITKDVPDYAVVAGVPARIIKYRYTPNQIEALNKIEWWNWTDDEIRERYSDLYLPVDEFIRKYSRV